MTRSESFFFCVCVWWVSVCQFFYHVRKCIYLNIYTYIQCVFRYIPHIYMYIHMYIYAYVNVYLYSYVCVCALVEPIKTNNSPERHFSLVSQIHPPTHAYSFSLSTMVGVGVSRAFLFTYSYYIGCKPSFQMSLNFPFCIKI